MHTHQCWNCGFVWANPGEGNQYHDPSEHRRLHTCPRCHAFQGESVPQYNVRNAQGRLIASATIAGQTPLPPHVQHPNALATNIIGSYTPPPRKEPRKMSVFTFGGEEPETKALVRAERRDLVPPLRETLPAPPENKTSKAMPYVILGLLGIGFAATYVKMFD
jgi:hypothetical protein